MLNIEPIEALSDNYIWLLTVAGTDACAVVDPGQSAPVEAALAQRNLRLVHILLTHHHYDHIDGANALIQRYGASVTGPADERIPFPIERVGEGDCVEIPDLALRFEVLEVPGHTLSHIAFHGHEALFIGDTLFSAGCGRLFEGTPEMMQTSLDKLQRLAPDTRVCCGHEYTQDNCRFALKVEPDNHALRVRFDQARELRSAGMATVPSTLREEYRVNPFLRTREKPLIEAARSTAPNGNPEARPGAETLGIIRAWKDGA